MQWRNGYYLVTPAMAAPARSEHVGKDVKFSGHAPSRRSTISPYAPRPQARDRKALLRRI